MSPEPKKAAAMTHAEMQASAKAPTALPADKELVLRVLPMPADSNANGDVFGGWIMAQVDLAGSVLPSRIAKGRITTAELIRRSMIGTHCL